MLKTVPKTRLMYGYAPDIVQVTVVVCGWATPVGDDCAGVLLGEGIPLIEYLQIIDQGIDLLARSPDIDGPGDAKVIGQGCGLDQRRRRDPTAPSCTLC